MANRRYWYTSPWLIAGLCLLGAITIGVVAVLVFRDAYARVRTADAAIDSIVTERVEQAVSTQVYAEPAPEAEAEAETEAAAEAELEAEIEAGAKAYDSWVIDSGYKEPTYGGDY